jgi:hypothetical protein
MMQRCRHYRIVAAAFAVRVKFAGTPLPAIVRNKQHSIHAKFTSGNRGVFPEEIALPRSQVGLLQPIGQCARLPPVRRIPGYPACHRFPEDYM